MTTEAEPVHRTVTIAWQPDSASGWAAFSAAREDAGRLWRDMVIRHARIRRFGQSMMWPTALRWTKWVKNRYKDLHSQSAQQTVHEFLVAVQSASLVRRKHGVTAARYPWRTAKWRDVVYTNQAVRRFGDCLILSNGKINERLSVRLPTGLVLPGRLMEVRLSFGKVGLVCKLDEPKTADGEAVAVPVPTVTIGVDLGVNTLIAAGDDQRAVLVSGREAKATIQWRNKRLAGLQGAQADLTKGSRRWRRMQRRKLKMLDKAASRLTDILHKATRKIADAFPNAKAIVGKPFNDAAQKMGRVQAQQVSQVSGRRIIELLAYKMASVTEVEEHYTSQTCPVCGERRRVRRVYECKSCGFKAPRDVVGLTNIRRIGIHGGMVPSPDVPRHITYVMPHRKYPGETRRPEGRRSQVVPGEPRHVARRAAQVVRREARLTS